MKSLEDELKELEGISDSIKDPQVSLEEALALFEKGIALSRFCAEKLEVAKQKVSILTVGEDGVVTDMPFAEEDLDEN